MIFIDSNIPMYLVGAAHPHKVDARRILEESIAARQRLVTDVEVFQEIMHRYAAINRKDAIQPAFEVLLGIVDEVFPIELADIELAKNALLGYKDLSARDALHISVMKRRNVATICTFDKGYSLHPGIEVLDS